MSTYTRVGAVSVLLTLCAGCGHGHGNASTTEPASGDLFGSCPALHRPSSPAGSIGAIVDARVTTEMEMDGLPGMTVEIAKDGKVLYAQAYGYASLAPSCIPARVDTEYMIGSVTKQFTAAAILQLQSAGTIDIDQPVVTYMPHYSIDPRITLRMLLNQTSGLADYQYFPLPPGYVLGSAIPQQQLLDAIATAPADFPPGSAHEYSDSNSFVLGAIIEAVTSQSYADYMAAHIFQPAGLTHTSLTKPATAALPYSYDYPAVAGTPGLAAGIAPDPSVYFSSGAIWSNVQDLATWDAALRDGKIISAAQVTAMVTPPVGISVYQQPGTPTAYAMGWFTFTETGHPAVWHNGQGLSYTASNEIFLDDGFSVSILTNLDIQETTPLLPFTHSLIQAICSSPETAASC